MKTLKQYILLSFIFLFIPLMVGAESFTYLRQIKYPLNSDYILSSPQGQVELNVSAQTSNRSLIVKMMDIVPQKRINRYFTYAKDLTPVSNLYFIKFSPFDQDNFNIPAKITMTYEPDNTYQEVYYYNWSKLGFEKVETERDPLSHTLTFDVVNKKSMMFALFSEASLVGKASWYVYPKYAGELITASRDFAKGTKLKVTNLYNNREVIVTVKDYGPKLCVDWTEKEQRLMGPCQERVLDLSKTAFLRLATTTGQGIISEIRVEPWE